MISIVACWAFAANRSPVVLSGAEAHLVSQIKVPGLDNINKARKAEHGLYDNLIFVIFAAILVAIG